VALGIPLVAIDHLQAHVYACQLAAGRDIFPCIGLIVSGGHTSLYRCGSPLEFTPLGGTIDDAAGEAFDKVAALLGLPYPGGRAIEAAAWGGDPRAFSFPRPFINDRERLEFSFSGLKTAVRYQIQPPGEPPRTAPLSVRELADLAASFQAAVVDCLAAKSLAAIEQSGLRRLCVGGGVAANKALRGRLEAECRERGVELHIPPAALCTDNAVMGAIAVERIKAGQIAPLDLDAFPAARP